MKGIIVNGHEQEIADACRLYVKLFNTWSYFVYSAASTSTRVHFLSGVYL